MSISNSKKEKYISFLKKIGFLINYNTLELYHGRSQTSNVDWCVKTDVDNSFDANTNNIMGIPCLCVASYGIAESYAKGASLDGRTGEMKIHEIVSIDDSALIINEKFDVNKLNPSEQIKFNQAIYALTSGAIKTYVKTKCNGDLLWQEFNSFKLISENDAEKLYKTLSAGQSGLDKALIDDIVGAKNADLCFKQSPVITASNYVFGKQEKRGYVSVGGQRYRINQDYIRKLLDKNNIIGLNKKAFSGTNDYIVYIFNLSKVQTLEKLSQEELQ